MLYVAAPVHHNQLPSILFTSQEEADIGELVNTICSI